MPDDSISTQRHAELAAEHKRKSEWHSGLAGGKQPDTSSVGSQAGGFVGAIMEHKWIVIGGIAAVIAFILVMRGQGSQGSSTANQSPDLSQGNFVPSNISTALDNINSAITGLSNQIANQSGNSNNSNTPPPPNNNNNNNNSNPPPPSVPPPPPPPPTPQYVSVTPWPTPLSTLWGISQQYGITLARIEQLNPQIANPDLIYPGQQVRIS